MSFPPATEMFQFAGFASASYVFRCRYPLRGGLPHSDIRGSKPIGGSPQLIAAYHVLHRLLAPRHPPNALLMLDFSVESIAHRDKPRTRQTPLDTSTAAITSSRYVRTGKQGRGLKAPTCSRVILISMPVWCLRSDRHRYGGTPFRSGPRSSGGLNDLLIV